MQPNTPNDMRKAGTGPRTAKYVNSAEGINWSVHKEHFVFIIPSSAKHFEEKVAAVKWMIGKWWDKKLKRWYVPTDCFRQVITYQREFKVAISQEAVERIRHFVKFPAEAVTREPQEVENSRELPDD